MKQCTWIRLAKENIQVKNKRLTHIYRPGSIFRTEGDVTYIYTGFCGKGDKSRTGAMATMLGADMPTAYGANNHGSIVQIGEDWYIFYHRHTNNTWYSRQGCARKLLAYLLPTS